MSGSKQPPEVGFAAAMEELEGILERMDREEVDIDALATELERAAELLEVCRAKLRAADLEVTRIVERLEEESETPPVGEGGEAS